jgi:hypothetical protein
MTTVLSDPCLPDDAFRQALYDGAIALSAPTSLTREFCDFTRELLDEAFYPHHPETAQHHLRLERYVEILSSLKPTFIHHPRSKQLLQGVLEERGCDLERTYFDVPRLRSSTSGGYLTTGIAYAWHPHRDTWYSAPMAQINFWMPVYPIVAANAMAFHPHYFDVPVQNSSSNYNYYEWNTKYRASAASNIGTDSRPLPGPTSEVDIDNPLVFLPPVGGLIAFSGQHLHSSVPNLSGVTRFSIDFRTVHVGDIIAGRAARAVDVACTGSSIRDFIRASDLAPMPADVVELFADGTEDRGDVIYAGNVGDSAAR